MRISGVNKYLLTQNTIQNNKYGIGAKVKVVQSILNQYGQDNVSEIRRAEIQDSISAKTEAIRSKLRSGKELSPKEKEFLKEHSPDLYKQVVKLDMERERYRRELQACNSKEDAERLHSQKTLSCMKGIKEGDEYSYFLFKAYEDEYKKYREDGKNREKASIFKLI